MNIGSFTSLLGRAIDFLFVDDRHATSMGVLFGALMFFVTLVFAPALKQQSVVDFAAVPPYLFAVVGVFVFNAPRFFGGERLPRATELRLKMVREELRAGRLSRSEAHALYKTVMEEELASLVAQRSPRAPTPRGPHRATV